MQIWSAKILGKTLVVQAAIAVPPLAYISPVIQIYLNICIYIYIYATPPLEILRFWARTEVFFARLGVTNSLRL